MVGSPIGGSLKYWTSKTQAIDAGIGFSGDIAIHGDYLWHGWDVFPQPREGKLAAYVGLGLRMRNRDRDEADFGFRTPLGLEYWLAGRPLAVFVELVPVFRLNSDTALDLDGSIGMRWYFGKR